MGNSESTGRKKKGGFFKPKIKKLRSATSELGPRDQLHGILYDDYDNMKQQFDTADEAEQKVMIEAFGDDGEAMVTAFKEGKLLVEDQFADWDTEDYDYEALWNRLFPVLEKAAEGEEDE